MVTGIVAAVVTLVVVYILSLIVSPGPSFGWALGVSVVNAFFAGYFGHIAGYREGR
ncbi:MAG: hypothetical protein ACUVX9_16545 [Anaerolineae bacterium]